MATPFRPLSRDYADGGESHAVFLVAAVVVSLVLHTAFGYVTRGTRLTFLGDLSLDPAANQDAQRRAWDDTILLDDEPDELDEYQKLLTKRYDGLLEIYKSAPYFLELMPFGVSKGSMLPLLLEKLGVKREELIAFGDHYNDMTMIGYAGMGVAMANGEEEIKKIADYVCESNDEDGIAKTLERFVLR